MTNRPISVLIIDDSVDDRTLYKRALGKVSAAEYLVDEATEGKAGIARCIERKPDCILLDYSLPGLDGIAVLREIRTHYPHLPIVMLTGQGNESVAVEVMKAGAQDYLIKDSISSLSLHRAISNAMLYCAMEASLEQKRQSLEVFTRAMAHDLKEPVRAIKSFGELLLKETLTPSGQEYLDFVLKAACNMEALINNVSRYTRLEADNELEMEHVALADVIEQVKTNLYPLIQERKAELIVGGLPHVMGNTSMLTQLMQNLIVNAIQYCVDKVPVITISALVKGSRWHLSIHDNGPGVPEHFRESIFLPFKRLVGREVAGTGLGLAIAKRIAELHDATLYCDSAPGEGAAFVLSIPIREIAPTVNLPKVMSPEAIAVTETNAGSQDKLANILLVDDNPLDLKLTTLGLMERDGVRFNYHTAKDGNEALSWIKEHAKAATDNSIDLILLDINMPRMNGFELLMALQEEGLHHIPVSMLSTSNDVEDIRTAKQLGAAGYMVKPATMHQLQTVLESIPTLQLVNNGTQYQLQRAA